MTRVFNRCVTTLFASAALFTAPVLWAADDAGAAAESGDKLVTEFRGRPPFKRQLLTSEEVAELARFEETVAPLTGDEIRVTDFRGRPPFKREVMSADEVAALARFEETLSEDDGRSRRRGPPGKLNSRR